jgi:hypothetical protein
MSPAARERVREIEADGFELYFPAGLDELPEELHVGVRRFPRRIEPYWNGCAWRSATASYLEELSRVRPRRGRRP